MRSYLHALSIGALLLTVATPGLGEVALTSATMTGTGLPPGQTLPEKPAPAQPAASTPFTPKSLTSEKMLAWGPARLTGSGLTRPVPMKQMELRPGRASDPGMPRKPERRLP